VTRAATIERAVLIALAALLVAAPWLIPALFNPFWVSVIAEILIWSLFAASVNLLFGYVGLLSFGQALYFGFGMYGVAIGVDNFGLPFWPALALGIVAAMAMALVTGIFAVRLTWHYFAIITVVFSLIFYFLALTNKWLTGGDDGVNFNLPPTFALGAWRLEVADDHCAHPVGDLEERGARPVEANVLKHYSRSRHDRRRRDEERSRRRVGRHLDVLELENPRAARDEQPDRVLDRGDVLDQVELGDQR